MDDDFSFGGDGKKSEWNEQQNYSLLYFKLSNDCREAQAARSLELWHNKLECKMVHALGVIGEKEDRQVVFNIKKKLKDSINEVIITTDLKKKSIAKGKLADLLFQGETDIDFLINQRMPFLRIEEKIRLEDL
jgi:hypothetical protein